MNLDKFEKIDGREALKRLVEGEEVFTGKGSKMRLDLENHQMVNGYGGVMSFYPVNAILAGTWYIPKPFDVRQAMLERPNEWVGAYTNFEDEWFKVGFDTKRMRPVRSFMNSEAKVNLQDTRVFVIELADLDLCIPIEDVPEEATR